jgi:hypothetical protein
MEIAAVDCVEALLTAGASVLAIENVNPLLRNVCL